MSIVLKKSQILRGVSGIKTLVEKNQYWFSIWIFIMLSSLVFLWIGYAMAERLGLFLGLIFSIFLNLLIFIFSESRLISFFSATQLRGQDSWGIQEKIHELISHLNLEIPSIYIFKHDTSNAFTLGIPWRKSTIGLSTGLLQKLSAKELDALLAFLLIQIKQSETFLYGVVTILANTLTGVAIQLDRLWPFNFFFDKKQSPFLTLMSPIGWMLIKLVRSSKSYVHTDILASELIGERQTLAEVLWNLQGIAETCPMACPPCSSHLFIVNPESPLEPFFYEKAHPAIKYRLEKLIGYYPI